MAAKDKYIKIILRSSESAYFYTTKKNKNNREKLKFSKYDPNIRKHVMFDEEKMK